MYNTYINLKFEIILYFQLNESQLKFNHYSTASEKWPTIPVLQVAEFRQGY